MAVQRLTHLGICVSDLERSVAFYRDVLGCEECGRLELEGQPTATLNGWDDVHVRVAYLERDGARIELMEFPVPGPFGSKRPREMNQLGLTHLAFRVDDLDATLGKFEAAGGGVLAKTRLDLGEVHVVMAHDPDGVRFELMQAPGDPGAVPGSHGG